MLPNLTVIPGHAGGVGPESMLPVEVMDSGPASFARVPERPANGSYL